MYIYIYIYIYIHVDSRNPRNAHQLKAVPEHASSRAPWNYLSKIIRINDGNNKILIMTVLLINHNDNDNNDDDDDNDNDNDNDDSNNLCNNT